MLRRAKPLLGTFVEVTVAAATDAIEWRAADAAFEAVADVHRLMSFHERDSDVARINRGALRRAVEVDARTYTVLVRARELSRLSGGLFDCTIGHRMVSLGALPRLDPVRADPAATWRDVALLRGRRVRLRRPLAIDLGGIAKGFAVDQAVAALARAGGEAGCVNAGGDLRVFGPRSFPVAIRRPGAPGAAVPLGPLRDCALATTADCFAPAGAVVDPATGRSRASPKSVSILAPNCMDADALTKVVWLAEHAPLDLLEKLDARAIILGRAQDDGEGCAEARRAAG